MPTLTRPSLLSDERPRMAMAPPQQCPRCRRTNPSDASFCWFDGVNLRGTGTGLVGTSDLGRDFIFPSGRRCRTFDQLVAGCSDDWGAAKNLLRQGGLRQFLAGIGRMDLAVAADRAAGSVDLDLSLDQLLAQFPTSEELKPKLDLAPRRLHLPALHAGEQREFTLTLVNQGARLLHGEVKIECDPWLKFAGKAGENGLAQQTVKTGKKQQFVFTIDTNGLPAGQRYAGKLTLLTSGGVAEVPVSVDVVPIPFPLPPLTGAATPRELASSMKEVPKQVYGLLENGTIRQWFQQNGWQYPVAEAQAKGIAAVQQFFEALGLSKPPPLTVQPEEIKLTAMPGPVQRAEVALVSDVKKWIYARAEADKSWVRILEPEVAGPQRVTLALEIQTRHLTPGKTHDAALAIAANGGQRFRTPIRLELQTPHFSLGQKFLAPILLGLLTGLLIRLLILPIDLLARVWSAGQPGGFVSRFVMLSGWVGAAAVGYALARKREWRLLPAGLLVGGVAGLASAATLANLILALDGLAARLTPTLPVSPLAASFLGWLVLGLAAAFLLRLGGVWGQELLALWSRTLGTLLGRVGLGGLGRWLQA